MVIRTKTEASPLETLESLVVVNGVVSFGLVSKEGVLLENGMPNKSIELPNDIGEILVLLLQHTDNGILLLENFDVDGENGPSLLRFVMVENAFFFLLDGATAFETLLGLVGEETLEEEAFLFVAEHY